MVHEHAAHLIWDGNRGAGTATYAAYGRDWRAVIPGKPDLAGTADPAFRGAKDRHNPEDLFVSALAACHMLTDLALCARESLRVVAYEDDVRARLSLDPDGGGRFDEVRLRPVVTVAAPEDVTRAERLHAEAHDQCFLARSCRVEVRCDPVVRVHPEVGR